MILCMRSIAAGILVVTQKKYILAILITTAPASVRICLMSSDLTVQIDLGVCCDW